MGEEIILFATVVRAPRSRRGPQHGENSSTTTSYSTSFTDGIIIEDCRKYRGALYSSGTATTTGEYGMPSFLRTLARMSKAPEFSYKIRTYMILYTDASMTRQIAIPRCTRVHMVYDPIALFHGRLPWAERVRIRFLPSLIEEQGF